MAVYTSLNISDLNIWLKNFDIEPLKDLKGISAGVTNTNYLISTKQSKYILTIFEHHTIEELPFYINLMIFLQKHSFRCPKPILSKGGESLNLLKGKPALIVSFLEGHEIQNKSSHEQAYEITQIGQRLGQLHNLGMKFKESRENRRDLLWIKNKYQELKNNVSPGNQKLIEDEIYFLIGSHKNDLPSGIIHGDLFRDNVIYSQKDGPGFIDFYYACNEILVYDIAIAINDWCIDLDGKIDSPKLVNFMAGYEKERPLESNEHDYLPKALRWAALRFFISRLEHVDSNPSAEILSINNPEQFKYILIHRQSIEDLF